jgi:peptidoglycan/LPS O-acetylase OafA/YrhL
LESDSRRPELDGIRGIACLLVVLFHCTVLPLQAEFVPLPTETWRFVYSIAAAAVNGGVDLFFVLSGFLIGGILLDNRGASNYFQAFWIRRTARIFPVYVLLLLTYVVAVRLRPHVDAAWLDDWLLRHPLPLWSYVTFTQNYVMALHADTGPFWLGITWSLAIEEQFYLLVPLMVYLLPRRLLVVLAIACVLTAPVVRVWLWNAGGTSYAGYFPTPARMDSLMFGVLTALAVRSGPILEWARRHRAGLDAAAGAVVLLVLVCMSTAAVDARTKTIAFSLVSMFFAFAILRISLVAEGPYRAVLRTPVLVVVGLISYPWYMYHQAVNGLVHGLLLGRGPTISSYSEIAAAVLVLALSGALATLSTRYFERPFRMRAQCVRYRFEPAESHLGESVAEAPVSSVRP